MDPIRGSRSRLLVGRMVFQLSGATRIHAGSCEKTGAWVKRWGDAVHYHGPARGSVMGHLSLQCRVFRPTIVVHAGDGPADGPVSTQRRWFGRRVGGIRWGDGRDCIWSSCWISVGPRFRIWFPVFTCEIG